MSSANTRDDLFDGVELPKKEEPDTTPKPSTTTARTTGRSTRNKQPDGVPATRLAAWIVPLLATALVVVAWSISGWLVLAMATVFVISMIFIGSVHARRSKRKHRRGRRNTRSQRDGMSARSGGRSRQTHSKSGSGPMDRLKQKLGLGGKSGRGSASNTGRNGQARGGKLNPKNWGKKGKTAGQKSGAASSGHTASGKRRSSKTASSTGNRSSNGHSGRNRGTTSTGGARSSRSRNSNASAGKPPGAIGRNQTRRSRHYEPMGSEYDTQRPGFWQRRRLRKAMKTETASEEESPSGDTKKEDEKKTEDKTNDKHDIYGAELPFDDAGFPANIPGKQTNKQTTTSTNTYDDMPIDDMGFPMYPAPKREDSKMSNDIDQHTAAEFDDPRQVLRDTCLATAAEAQEKAMKTHREAELMEQKAKFYSQKGMDQSYLKAKKAQEKLSESAKRYMGIKAANEEAAAKAKSL